jgi:hypothetical protein
MLSAEGYEDVYRMRGLVGRREVVLEVFYRHEIHPPIVDIVDNVTMVRMGESTELFTLKLLR